LWILEKFLAARHISRTNCAEINLVRHGEAADAIFSIERKRRRSKSRFSRFKETCAQGNQTAVPRKSRYCIVVGQSFVKTVADRHGYAAYNNKH